MAWTSISTLSSGHTVLDTEWNALVNNILESAAAKVTTAGDIVYATGANALARLPIGTAGQHLQVNSGATAPEWATTHAVHIIADISGQDGAYGNIWDQGTSDMLGAALNEVLDTAGICSGTGVITFTAATAGYWLVSASVQGAVIGTAGTVGVRIKHNSAVVATDERRSPSGSITVTLHATAIVKVANTDTIKGEAKGDSAGGLSGAGDAVLTAIRLR